MLKSSIDGATGVTFVPNQLSNFRFDRRCFCFGFVFCICILFATKNPTIFCLSQFPTTWFEKFDSSSKVIRKVYILSVRCPGRRQVVRDHPLHVSSSPISVFILWIPCARRRTSSCWLCLAVNCFVSSVWNVFNVNLFNSDTLKRLNCELLR